jgi:adenine-specific DNA-methyltransferase
MHDLAVISEKKSGRERKSLLGQFFTPKPIAEFMASLFVLPKRKVIEILDPGVGEGVLTEMIVRRLCTEHPRPEKISVTAYELDGSLLERLKTTLSRCRNDCEKAGIDFSATLHTEDFIESAVSLILGDFFSPHSPVFHAAIVNPPYKKIRSESSTRILLRSVGIETSNLYAAFLALISKLLTPGGEMVSITPRSFCNGPYFKPFRSLFFKTMSPRRFHVFESRSAAFKEDKVLQENIIIHAIKETSRSQGIVISSSQGQPDGALNLRKIDYRDVISPDDPEQFVHLQVENIQADAQSSILKLPASLADLGLEVSTGRVVDFRAKIYLRQDPGKDTAPLVYPCHFSGGFVQWPKEISRKPNALLVTPATRELLIPSDIYVLVKRFTSKEERRRVVACVYDPKRIPAHLIGFENHLNYFHRHGRGLPRDLALGLAAFLNSTVVDLYFRQFSGHTQVNAADLRILRYPALEKLESLGKRLNDPALPQRELDRVVEKEAF